MAARWRPGRRRRATASRSGPGSTSSTSPATAGSPGWSGSGSRKARRGEARIRAPELQEKGVVRPALVGSAFLSLFLGAAANLAGDDAGLPVAPRPSLEWGAEAGYGFMAHLNSGRSEERVLLVEPSAGYPLSSRLEYIVEGHFARYLAPEGYMVGLMPVGLRLTIGNGAIRPYVSLGAGFGWADLPQLRQIDRGFNFLPPANAGHPPA